MDDERIPAGVQFEKIIARHADTAFRVAYQYLRNRQDAEDVVQEVFLSLVQRFRQLSFNDDEHLKAWIIRVTINKSINAAKYNARRRTESMETSVLKSYDKSSWEIDDVLSKLSADDRQIIYLHYYEGYQAKDIASFLNIAENAVHKRLSRARARLKKYLDEEDD